MSRSGYHDDYDDDQWRMIMWRGTVASSIRGKRGQAFLRDLLDALDAMPDKRLISHDLITPTGEVCAIGSLGVKRGIDLMALDPEDFQRVADAFGIASPLVREIEWMNDDAWGNSTPEVRWLRMREWVASLISATPPPGAPDA